MSKAIYFNRNGETGNIFYIMGFASRMLKSEGRAEDAETMRERVAQQESYEDALKVIREYVDLIDVSETDDDDTGDEFL